MTDYAARFRAGMWGPLCTRIAFCGTVRDWLLREFDACKAVGFSDDPHDRFEQMDWLVTFLRADMIPSPRALRLSRLRRLPPGQYFYIDPAVLRRFVPGNHDFDAMIRDVLATPPFEPL